MINPKDHPVGWMFLLDDLEDAHEHLGNLIKELSGPNVSEQDLSIGLGHVFAHLNRAWYRRNVPENFPDSDWDRASGFHADILPIG